MYQALVCSKILDKPSVAELCTSFSTVSSLLLSSSALWLQVDTKKSFIFKNFQKKIFFFKKMIIKKWKEETLILKKVVDIFGK